MHRIALPCLFALTIALTADAAQAQDAPPEDRPFSMQGGLGFTADPGGFLIGLEGDYRLQRAWSVAGRLKLAFEDDLVIVSPTGNLRYWFDLRDVGPESLRNISPFLQTGIGFTFIEEDDRRGDDDDIGFLVSVGGGVEARLTDELSLTSTLEFNIHPSDVLDENFYFSWEVAALRVRF